MTARRISHIATWIALTMILQTAIVAAEVVEVEIPAAPGTYALDLGISASSIDLVSLLAQGTHVRGVYDCEGQNIGGPYSYTQYYYTHVFISLLSGGDQASDDWFPPDGVFDAAVELTPMGITDDFLADGTGQILIEWWLDSSPENPPPATCTMVVDPSFTFAGPFVLRVEYTGLVGAEPTAWGAVKAFYR